MARRTWNSLASAAILSGESGRFTNRAFSTANGNASVAAEFATKVSCLGHSKNGSEKDSKKGRASLHDCRSFFFDCCEKARLGNPCFGLPTLQYAESWRRKEAAVGKRVVS